MVPPQTWVELVTQHGYGQDFGSFLLFDYFRFTTIDGVGVPTWNQLWFVGYLWTYTAVLALALLIPRPRILQHWFDRALGGWRALVLPAVYLVLTQVVIFHRWSDSQDLIHDGVAHLAYFHAFLFGFGLARSRAVMAGLVAWWKPAAALAVACFVFGVATGVGGWAVFLIGRVVSGRRPLIGLRRRARPASARGHVDETPMVAGGAWWRRRDRAQPDPACHRPGATRRAERRARHGDRYPRRRRQGARRCRGGGARARGRSILQRRARGSLYL